MRRRRLHGFDALAVELRLEPSERLRPGFELHRFVGDIDELLPADVDLVAVAQEMLGDRLAVDERSVGAAQILEERVRQDRDHGGVLAADGGIRQAHVVVGAPSDRDPLARERMSSVVPSAR